MNLRKILDDDALRAAFADVGSAAHRFCLPLLLSSEGSATGDLVEAALAFVTQVAIAAGRDPDEMRALKDEATAFLELHSSAERQTLPMDIAEAFVGYLPVGETQCRVLRGEEDPNLLRIITIFEAVLADRRRRLGGSSSWDASLVETLEICRSRLKIAGVP